MRIISAATINQQIASLPQYTMEEVEKIMQEESQEREEAIKLIDFHARGQYIGNDGKFYQMAAEYAEDSTEVFPKVLVTVTDESGNVSAYPIDITKVDTGRATEIEMFALCSHADSKRDRYEDISADTLSSWESLLFYRAMAEQKEGTAQGDMMAISGAETTYNWRDMVGSVAQAHMNDEAYDKYLHVNRMKDLLDYYSRFDGRPAMFENSFHAVRDYETNWVLSLDNGISIEVSDKQKKIICRGGRDILWGGELADDEYEKVMEIIREQYTDHGYGGPYQAFLGSYDFWDSILAEGSRLKDYGNYIGELKRHYQFNTMFDNCPNLVSTAWKRAEEQTGFSGLGMDKDTMEVEFISEYMRLLMEQMQKGSDTNLLGGTVESAIDMAKQMIQRLDETDFEQLSEENRRLKLKERNFYYYFIENLDPVQKFDPVELLLKA